MRTVIRLEITNFETFKKHLCKAGLVHEIVRWYWGLVLSGAKKRPDVLVWKIPFKICLRHNLVSGWGFRSQKKWISSVLLRCCMTLSESLCLCVLLSPLSFSCLVCWRLLLNFMTAAGQCIPQWCLKFCLGHPGSSNTVVWLRGSLRVAAVNQTSFIPLVPASTIWDFLLSYKMTKSS